MLTNRFFSLARLIIDMPTSVILFENKNGFVNFSKRTIFKHF